MLATIFQTGQGTNTLLSLLTFVPLLGMIAIFCVPKAKHDVIKTIAAAATLIPFVISIIIYFTYDKSGTGVEASQMYLVERYDWIPSYNISYYLGVDGLSVPILLLSCLLFFFAVFSAWGIEKGVKGFFSLLLLLEVGTNGCFVALDLFLFYVFWEVMLLPMYFLIGIWGGPRKEYAAIKFFLYTLAGSVLILLAIVAIYLKAGTFDLMELAQMAKSGELYLGDDFKLFGIFDFQKWTFWFMFIGFAVKIPIVPLHTWLPDAHVEAPTAISVILAGILLKLGAYGMLRINFPLGGSLLHDTTVLTIIGVIGTVSILYGAFVAMAQTDFKRLVAYSSVSHMGFVLLGFAAMNSNGMMGAATQLFNHGTSSAMMFLIVGVLYDRAHHRDLNRFGGLALHMPYYTGLATVGIFASIGLPGLASFISEVLVLFGAFNSDITRWMAVVSVLGIIMTAAYLLWTVQRVFLGENKNKEYLDYPDISGREVFCQAPFAILCLLFGVMPFLLLDVYQNSINGLLTLLGY